ncbi:SPOR domain-containing protein [Candidatus Marithrix sp. Canyon 246]|uniref:SPOR domain-containing protein n=1 Tax=Candidatus Marithrix sp. Canyon 246 TaxID=1827136 RepID=UPI000849ECDB|nr:SPOR domain-containing protein [Candidatus Marithrix sp. Canyon 246]
MQQRNMMRRANADTYDPKQRLVGGITLFIIMLLIYSSLKLVLGFASVPKGYVLEPAKQDEELDSITVATSTSTATKKINQVRASVTNKRLPASFVFLDLDGNAMQPENFQNVFNSPSELYADNDGETKWYIQAAAFRSEERAQSFAQQIQDKNIAPEVYIIPMGKWFLVRLAPETDRNIVKQQSRELRRSLHVKPAIKKIN